MWAMPYKKKIGLFFPLLAKNHIDLFNVHDLGIDPHTSATLLLCWNTVGSAYRMSMLPPYYIPILN